MSNRVTPQPTDNHHDQKNQNHDVIGFVNHGIMVVLKKEDNIFKACLYSLDMAIKCAQ